jgi:hypothetical protein
MQDTLDALDALGYWGMRGLLKAKAHKLITDTEYHNLEEYAIAVYKVPRDWWRTLVWSI